MAPKRKATAKTGRKVKAIQKGYSMKMKTLARAWKFVDKLTNSQIKKKFKELYNIDIPDSTLSTWWCPKNMEIVANMAEDRLNVDDKRLNPRQRPDVIVDMKKILLRKVICVKLKGIPYTREMIDTCDPHISEINKF